MRAVQSVKKVVVVILALGLRDMLKGRKRDFGVEKQDETGVESVAGTMLKHACVKHTLEAGREYGSKEKMFILRSCRRWPCNDLDSARMSSGVTSAAESLIDCAELDKVLDCCGSISWTVDLNRTAGPTPSSVLKSDEASGALLLKSVDMKGQKKRIRAPIRHA